MYKICSFLIILIIIYLSYDYCSHTLIEGAGSTMTQAELDKQDNIAKQIKCSSPPATKIKGSSATEACAYEKVSCMTLMDEVSNSDWGDSYTDYGGSGSNYIEDVKKQCHFCVKGSKQDGNARHILANVGGTADSHFAYDICDAMVAKCSSDIIYANNRQGGWDHDCGVTLKKGWGEKNNINMSVCTLLSNSIIQFFLGFMGGIECTLLIKAREFENSAIKKMECIPCTATFGHGPGCTEKKNKRCGVD
tara:strand:+ start:980 stop:1726 length:747 start_codon:yes stop_codon:yes gene_type:complete